jgi:hypothetical protein
MDAKRTRGLVFLAALSLFCASVAWAEDYAFSARFLPRSVPSPFSAPQPRGTGADMNKDYLTLKRASASRPSGEWSDDDYDVLAEGVVVGRIFHAAAAPVGSPWMWTLGYGFHEDRNPTHGYEPTREAAMAAFAKSWRRS